MVEIEYKNEKIKYGYIGMNKFAAKVHGIDFPKKQGIIQVYKKVPKKVRLHTIRHELCELYLMKNLHYNYQKAHKIALKFETFETPFPKHNKRRFLKSKGLI